MKENKVQEQSNIVVKEKDEILNEEKQMVKEEIEKNETKNQIIEDKPSKKFKIALIVFAIIFLIIAILSVVFAVINIGNKNIIKGVYISKIDVSQMSREKAKETLEEIYSKMQTNEIYLQYGEFESTTTFEALEVQYKIDDAINKAYEVGRKGNLFIDNYEIVKTWFKGNQIDIDISISQEMINQIAQNINNSIEGAVVQADYSTESDKIIISKGTEGFVVEENKLSQEIYRIVKEEGQSQKLDIPLITVQPNEIDIEMIHEEVYKEVKDAYYTTEPFAIYPESKGIDFDIENAKRLLSEDREKYEIPLIITKPSKTTKDIGTEAFPDRLATFSTKYQASNVNRTTNLRLAANKINGTVLLPGEEFSYNKTVGERTVAAGFKEAAIFNAGRVENGLGGGICQISSTLYDAAVYANLDIIERHNHMFLAGYVGAGKDATVVYGSLDFKFKNTRNYPIMIKTSIGGGTAKISIYGIKEETEYEVEISTTILSNIPYKVIYEEDKTLAEGKERVAQGGMNGCKSITYKILRLNGKEVSRTVLSSDTYDAMNKIIKRGPKKVVETNTKPEKAELEKETSVTPEKPETPVEKPSTEPVVPEEKPQETPEQTPIIPSETPEESTEGNEQNVNG